jgi:hypothetical protein
MTRHSVTATGVAILLLALLWTGGAPAATDPELQAAREELRLRAETERRMRRDFESLLADGKMTAAEIADFEDYLLGLGMLVNQQRRTVAKLEGAGSEHGIGAPGSEPLPADFNRGQTGEEKVALLDAELGTSLSAFDEKLLREQKEISEKSRNRRRFPRSHAPRPPATLPVARAVPMRHPTTAVRVRVRVRVPRGRPRANPRIAAVNPPAAVRRPAASRARRPGSGENPERRETLPARARRAASRWRLPAAPAMPADRRVTLTSRRTSPTARTTTSWPGSCARRRRASRIRSYGRSSGMSTAGTRAAPSRSVDT